MLFAAVPLAFSALFCYISLAQDIPFLLKVSGFFSLISLFISIVHVRAYYGAARMTDCRIEGRDR